MFIFKNYSVSLAVGAVAFRSLYVILQRLFPKLFLNKHVANHIPLSVSARSVQWNGLLNFF